jgi:hypothetical protein
MKISASISYLCWKSILEFQQVKVDVSNGAGRSTDDGMNGAVRLLQKVSQPVLNVSLCRVI